MLSILIEFRNLEIESKGAEAIAAGLAECPMLSDLILNLSYFIQTVHFNNSLLKN